MAGSICCCPKFTSCTTRIISISYYLWDQYAPALHHPSSTSSKLEIFNSRCLLISSTTRTWVQFLVKSILKAARLWKICTISETVALNRYRASKLHLCQETQLIYSITPKTRIRFIVFLGSQSNSWSNQMLTNKSIFYSQINGHRSTSQCKAQNPTKIKSFRRYVMSWVLAIMLQQEEWNIYGFLRLKAGRVTQHISLMWQKLSSHCLKIST